MAAMHEQAKRTASAMSVNNPTVQKWRDGLRHMCGARTFPPEQEVIDALVELGLVKLAQPDAVPVRGRYQVTDLGSEVLGLIGGRG